MRKVSYDIHITDVQRFKRCRWLWDYASTLRQNLEPVERYTPFFLGSLVHYALEHHTAHKQPIDISIRQFLNKELGERAIPEALAPTITLARQMLEHYMLWQHFDTGPYADRKLHYLHTEYTYSVQLWSNTRRAINLAGKFDGIVQHRDTKKYYLKEYKTTRSITEREQQLLIDSQSDAYLIAADEVLHQLGIDARCSGILYTLLRKKAPSEPKILKTGMLSLDKSQDTTAEYFGQFARKHHSNCSPTELQQLYGDLMVHLRTSGTPFFKRVLIARQPAELAQAKVDLLAVAHEMIDPRVALYPTDDERCNYCLFRTPCIMRRRGQMADETRHLEAHYELNDYYQHSE